ncbi:isoprenoid synthase domain-containing protein, partial [Catenaria anguillulae PL171]
LAAAASFSASASASVAARACRVHSCHRLSFAATAAAAHGARCVGHGQARCQSTSKKPAPPSSSQPPSEPASSQSSSSPFPGLPGLPPFPFPEPPKPLTWIANTLSRLTLRPAFSIPPATPPASSVNAASALPSTASSANPPPAYPPFQTSPTTSWSATLDAAERIVLPPGGKLIDPMEVVGAEMKSLTSNIQRLLTSDSQVLRKMARYYFNTQGKHIRPLLVLLVSMAARAAHAPGTVPPTPSITPATLSSSSLSASEASVQVPASFQFMDTPISPVLAHDSLVATAAPGTYDPNPLTGVLPTQRRLAEITEMIHTASLLHDDVIDHALTRRGVPTVNAEQGNKMAILAGDYLLARASLALARLRHCEVVELLATVISDLVEGEVMQLKNGGTLRTPAWQSPSDVPNPLPGEAFDHYMEKTYLKTAALIAKSCRAAALLGGAHNDTAHVAYTYGKHLGLAFQLVDDLLDFTGSAVSFGKPAGGADLKLGLATAPVLFAAQEYPELNALIERRFSRPDDPKRAFDLVHASQGLVKTRDFAAAHARRAAEEVRRWPETPAREALVAVTEKVLTRSK